MTLIADDKADKLHRHMVQQNHDAIQEAERIGGFFAESEADAHALWQRGVANLQQALTLQFLNYAERVCEGDRIDAAMSLGIPLDKALEIDAAASGRTDKSD